jgi:hypothetical protein
VDARAVAGVPSLFPWAKRKLRGNPHENYRTSPMRPLLRDGMLVPEQTLHGEGEAFRIGFRAR